MKVSIWSLFVFLLLAFISAGCSGSVEQIPATPSGEISQSNDMGRFLFGAYDLIIDQAGPSVEVEPMRYTVGHFDVLKYLVPPLCDKCFFADIIAYDPYANAYSISIGIRNYSQWVVYDPRGVVVESTGYQLINPSGYFRIGPGGTPLPDLYGYIDIDSGLAGKMYPPGLFKEYDIVISLPLGGKLAHVPFIIDACYPDNCKEVYSMKHLGNTGSLTTSGGSLTVEYEVKDWQGDVIWMKVNANPLMGQWVSFTKTGPDTWEGTLTNSLGSPKGTYRLEAGAYSPNAKGIILYDYFDVIVN